MTQPAPIPEAIAAPPVAPARPFGARLLQRFVTVYLTADLRSLAAGRITMSLVMLFDLVNRWRQLDLWYTNEGLVPNHTLLWRPGFDYVFSLFFMASHPHEAAFGFVVCAIAFTSLLLGFRTRLSQVVSWLCLLSLHGRMLLFDNGGDVVLGLLCTWTTFLPTGRYWSVDAVLARRRARLEASTAPQIQAPASAPPRAEADGDRSFASLGVLALFCQLAFIYFFNAVHKGGTTWRDGSAVHYVLHLDRLVTPFGLWLRAWIPDSAARLLTWSTLAIEWSLPWLLLSPVGTRYSRRLAVLLVIVLHTGFGLCMNLGNFVPAMIAFAPNFIHGDDWDAFSRWWSRGPRRVELEARLSARATSLIERAADLLTPGREVRVSEPGRWAKALARRLPAAREATVALFIVIAGNQLLDENWAAHKVIDHHNSPPVVAAVHYLDLFQGWSMFAPEAPTTDFNIVVDAVTVDGRHVDPFNEVANPRYPNPGLKVPPSMDPSWLFYGYENHLPSRPEYFQALHEWILRYPDRTGRPQDQIVSFRVLKVEDDSPPLGSQTPTNLRSAELLKFP